MKRYLNTLVLGIFAGLFIAFGGLGSIMVKATLDCKTMGGNIVAALVFSIGLCLVCFLGCMLYTGKIAFVIDKMPKEKYIDLPVMLVGNAIGAIGFGYICGFLYKDNTTVMNIVTNLATGKETQIMNSYVGFFQVLLSSMFCGMFVFLAVFFYQKSTNIALKILGIVAPIFLFVLFGFDHVVANMFYFGFKGYSLEAFYHLLTDLLGNSLGAIIIYLAFKYCHITVHE